MGPAAAHPSEHVLDLYVLGRLTPEEDATVTTHVEACEECQEQIADTINLIQDLRLAFGQVQASLNTPLDVHPFATLPADERFDQAEARKGVEGAATRASGATDFR